MKESTQFKRTDKAILYAFETLLEQKPFEKITIQDILDEAPVSRNTFYAHFRDKYDIAEHYYHLFQENFSKFKQTVYDDPHNGFYENDDPGQQTLFLSDSYEAFGKENEKLLRILQKIRLPEYDPHASIIQFLSDSYENDPYHSGKSAEALDLEKQIYAGILSALTAGPHSSRSSAHLLDQDFQTDCILSAALYACGIRMPESKDRAVAAVKKIQKQYRTKQASEVYEHQNKAATAKGE